MAPMRFTAALFAAALALCCAAAADASTTAADTVTVARAAQPLPLDPALTDAAWQAGKIAVGSGFADLTTRRAAPVGTTAYLLYDDRALYVAFHAAQAGIPIAASQTTNGVGFGTADFV